jgi:hypothetical protein
MKKKVNLFESSHPFTYGYDRTCAISLLRIAKIKIIKSLNKFHVYNFYYRILVGFFKKKYTLVFIYLSIISLYTQLKIRR